MGLNNFLKKKFSFTSLITIPLADAVAIFFIAPLMITLLSVVILREKVNISSLASVFIGFLGVVIILRPGYGFLILLAYYLWLLLWHIL